MATTKTLILKRKDNRPSWVFNYDNEKQGYFYQGRTHLYRLFFGSPVYSYKPFWIGMLVKTKDGKDTWVSVEHEIHAQEIEFLGSKIIFT